MSRSSAAKYNKMEQKHLKFLSRSCARIHIPDSIVELIFKFTFKFEEASEVQQCDHSTVTHIYNIPLEKYNRLFILKDSTNLDALMFVKKDANTLFSLQVSKLLQDWQSKCIFPSKVKKIQFIGISKHPRPFEFKLTNLTRLNLLEFKNIVAINWENFRLPKRCTEMRFINSDYKGEALTNVENLKHIHIEGQYRPMQIWNNDTVGFPSTLETFRSERIILHADFSNFEQLHKIRLIDVNTTSIIFPLNLKELDISGGKKNELMIHDFSHLRITTFIAKSIRPSEQLWEKLVLPFTVKKLILDKSTFVGDLSYLYQLQEVSLQECELDKMLKKIILPTALLRLQLNRSPLNSTDLSYITGLENLSLQKMRHPITEDIILPTNLKTLCLTSSDIGQLDLSNLCELEVLLCRYCTVFDWSKFIFPENTRVLNLDWSNYDGLYFLQTLRSLEELHLQHIFLSNPIYFPDKLQTLSIKGTNLDKMYIPKYLTEVRKSFWRRVREISDLSINLKNDTRRARRRKKKKKSSKVLDLNNSNVHFLR